MDTRPVAPDRPRPSEHAASPREERRIVTVVFADLVGSTPLAERLGPEEARLIVGEAVGRVVAAVEAFGGTVHDLAGGRVPAPVRAPVAPEDRPVRALPPRLRGAPR